MSQPLLAELTFTRGALSDNTQNGINSNVPGTFTFDGTEIARNGTRGLYLWNAANVYAAELRNCDVIDNGHSGVYVTGAAGSSLDLGTLAGPGGNALSGNNTTSTSGEAGVHIDLPSTLVPAVGNTWTPNEQGADAEGEYSATGAGAVLEFTSGMGRNYTVTSGTLRVAQNP